MTPKTRALRENPIGTRRLGGTDGLIFDASGTTAYLAIQHSEDGLMPDVDGYATDDVLKVTGFKIVR